MVIFIGFVVDLSPQEWVSILIVIGWVISMEAVNTAIENLSNKVSPDQNDLIGKVKDLSAAAVLVSVIAAVTVGLVIFIPKILQILER